jgi:mannitol 2-dehydrogenase
MAIALNDANLKEYTGPATVPGYDRSSVRAGILHFGVGGFHRSHLALYVDKLLERGDANDWAICGVGVLPNDARMRDVLNSQDHLYTLIEKSPDGSMAGRVMGSIVDYLFVPDDPDRVIEKVADPAIKIITMTITEGGYNLDMSTHQFKAQDPVILDESRGVGIPRTHFRILHEGLRRRHERGIPFPTIASCDNIQGNGHVAKSTLVQYIALSDPDFAKVVEDSVAFPNSMVDRITPITSDEDRGLAVESFGIIDGWPVPAESYCQWVLEDNFPVGRPAFEDVGAQLVPDVIPYELMKLRLLNASHQVIGYFSFLSEHGYVHEAMADPLIRGAVARFQEFEAQPTLPPVPGIDLAEYRATLLDRFSNPGIRDTIARQCLQTSTTIPNFLLPIVRDQLKSGGDITVGAATVAAWATYATEAGGWQIVDKRRDKLIERANDTVNPYAFIEDEELFGELAADEQFRHEYRRWHELIAGEGIRSALEALSR